VEKVRGRKKVNLTKLQKDAKAQIKTRSELNLRTSQKKTHKPKETVQIKDIDKTKTTNHGLSSNIRTNSRNQYKKETLALKKQTLL